MSGQEAAERLGVSRTAVFKRISILRKQGYVIESAVGKGYKLSPRFDGLLPLEIRSKNKSKVFGREVVTKESVDSTQNCLRGLAEKGAPEGTVVVALEQTAGKGRMERRWSSPRGGLWFSLLLRPRIPLGEIYKLTLLFGASVSLALEPFNIKSLIKWPNDLLFEDKKLCGILTETSAEPERLTYVLVGIGVNANFSVRQLPEELRERSTSTYDILGKNIDRAELLGRILEKSEELYSEAGKSGFAPIIESWRRRSCTLGRKVMVKSIKETLKGLAVDLNDDGSLLLETGKKRVSVYSGDVTFL